MLKFICKSAGSVVGRTVGNMIFPGIGGEFGALIMKIACGSYSDVASDPTNWAEGIKHSAECIESLGFDPFDFL